jgi:hypothetical protein
MVKITKSPIVGAIDAHEKPTFLMVVFTPHIIMHIAICSYNNNIQHITFYTKKLQRRGY